MCYNMLKLIITCFWYQYTGHQLSVFNVTFLEYQDLDFYAQDLLNVEPISALKIPQRSLNELKAKFKLFSGISTKFSRPKPLFIYFF